ncbi:alpha/beta hydrolase [Lysobacter sp. A3-1-A15]|uniref:alpha/beta hydrolase n=1 Tax=Novilysobacter viscosus TaxID=3098602 RepID=UPI002EDB638A
MRRPAGIQLIAPAMLAIAALAACMAPGARQDMAAQTFDVQVPAGAHQLPGTLFVAQGPGPHPTVVWFHGFPGLPAPMPEAVKTLRDAGLNVLHVHYSGSWGTPGSFGPASAMQDAAAVLAHVRAAPASWRVDREHIITAGDSFGSWVALQAAAADPRVACVAGALMLDLGRTGRDIASSEDMRAAFGGMFAQVEQDASLGFELDGGAAGLMASIVDGHVRHDLHALGSRLAGRPVLLIGAAEDELAPIDAHLLPVAEALAAAGADVTHKVLPGGHEIPDSAYAGIVADWARGSCD